MTKLRPARTCRNLQRPWTRTAKKVVQRAYVRGVPDPKIGKFEMGTPQKMEEYEISVDILSGRDGQIRHNALDACRMAVNRFLDATVLQENYWFKIRVYPHHALREHAMLSGAGADRLSQGMKHAFGRPTGRAAQVKAGQKLMTICTYKRFEKQAMEAAHKAASRLPLYPKIVLSALDKQQKDEIRTEISSEEKPKAQKKPRKTKEDKVEEGKPKISKSKAPSETIGNLAIEASESKSVEGKDIVILESKAEKPVMHDKKPAEVKVLQEQPAKKESVNRMMERVLEEAGAKKNEAEKKKEIVML